MNFVETGKLQNFDNYTDVLRAKGDIQNNQSCSVKTVPSLCYIESTNEGTSVDAAIELANLETAIELGRHQSVAALMSSPHRGPCCRVVFL